MLKLFLVFQLVGPGRAEHPGGDSWLGPDKLQHFLLAGFVQSVSYGVVRSTGASYHTSLGAASGVTALVSVGKEWHDAQGGGTPSAKDLVWDAAGAAGASVMLRQTVH